MKIAVLDAKTLGDANLEALEKFGAVEIYQTTTAKQLHERIADADIIVTNKVVIDKETMDRAHRLKLICVAATGMNNIDLNYAAKKKIGVKNVAGYSTKSVVQHTFAMAFYLIEQLSYYDDYVKSGRWSQSGIFTCIDRPFFEIAGKRWGIIGLGTIGKEVAKVAQSFGCEAVYHSTSGKNLDAPYPHLSLEEILRTSQIVSIHAPLNEKTKNLIGYKELGLLQKKSVLLNLGRGGIVDEEALAKTINEKEIYVGLDVTEKEPLPKESPLLHIKNKDRLLITPHIAWTSEEARKELVKGIVRNIEEYLRSQA